MLGAAQGLAYLHEELEVQVIYRDFKSSNVLLDEDFEPKLSDFELAREGPKGDRTHVPTAVVGTYGLPSNWRMSASSPIHYRLPISLGY
ncbi:hypothetical protein ABKV19_012967 [Rosa sericea]